ncbi:MAG: O-antigen ligase family protein [Mucinivorans sp.]
MGDRKNKVNGSNAWLYPIVITISLILISFVTVFVGLPQGLIVASIPMVLLLIGGVISSPFAGFVVLFILNYFVVILMRYSGVSGLSVLIDVMIVMILISISLNAAFATSNESRKNHAPLSNGLILVSVIWAIYCGLELLNPSAMTSMWVLNRNLSVYMLLVAVATFLSFKTFRNIQTIIMILSVLTLIGIAKALMQKYLGFDAYEQRLLDSGLADTHLLFSGIRFFSIYVSAGIFGAVMGHAMVVFSIVALYEKGIGRRIYFIVVALASLYGMLISGTRGALAVPLAGFFLFAILSKQLRLMVPTVVVLLGVYIFLAMTTIGQSNATIRRMRTAFDPNEPSLMVRKANKKLFAEYLADKPFGEGLGLSGVDVQSVSMRYTTSIPTDSWFVKIWVETGIVGLCLHIAILAYIVLYGSYLILFKIRNRQLRGVLSALLCGVFGIIASSYGNQVLGQFPVSVVVYMSMALVFMGKYFDRQLEVDDNVARLGDIKMLTE